MNLEFLYDLFEKALTENLKKLNKQTNDESNKQVEKDTLGRTKD